MKLRNQEYFELLETRTAAISNTIGADPELVRQVLASLPDSVLPRACSCGVQDILEGLEREARS